jgi:hypothetical protein
MIPSMVSAVFRVATTTDGHRLILRDPPPPVIVVLSVGGVVPEGHPWVTDDEGRVRYGLDRVDADGVFRYIRL